MGYLTRHWHALLIGAAGYWAVQRFVLPMVTSSTGG
jgi:hypothetical protein